MAIQRMKTRKKKIIEEEEEEEAVCNNVLKPSYPWKIYAGRTYPTGIDITPGQQLAVGALVYADGSGVFCSATLVSDRVVVSAAHCAQGIFSVSQTRFAVGPDASNPLASFQIQSVKSHDSYRPWGIGDVAAYDISVLVLAESVFKLSLIHI